MPPVVFAIDPGPEKSAWVIWDGTDIIAADIDSNLEVLLMVDEAVNAGRTVCIEMIASYGMAVGAEVFETCVWIGRFMQVVDACGQETARLTRIQIKSHLCHSGKAKDANIRQALIDRLGAPGTKRAPGNTYGITADMWAALAVAVTYWDREAETERNSGRTAVTAGERR